MKHKHLWFFHIFTSVSVSCILVACSVSGDSIYPLRVTQMDNLALFPGQVSMWLENVNNDCIVFPYDFGLEIYYEENNEKHEISNLMEYSPHDNIILGAKGEFFSISTISFTPDMTGITVSDTTRFIAKISGTMCKSGTPFIQEIPFTIP